MAEKIRLPNGQTYIVPKGVADHLVKLTVALNQAKKDLAWFLHINWQTPPEIKGNAADALFRIDEIMNMEAVKIK